jgi:hypothetical protein
MVCITSRAGRVILRTMRLFAARMPIGMPMITETSVPISINASVCIVRSQSPKTPIKSSSMPTVIVTTSLRVPIQASAMKIKIRTHHGVPRRMVSMKMIACNTVCAKARNANP